jgi:hypothetical protein
VPGHDPGNIFVSYSRVDLAWVDKLVRKLEVAGLKVWLDVHELHAGKPWDSEIGDALQGMGVLMVVLSPDSVKSRNVLDEINFALNKNRIVVPVLYRPCDVPYRVERLQRVDFTGNDDAAFPGLVEILKAALNESGAAAASDTPRHDEGLPAAVTHDRLFENDRGIPKLPSRLLGLLALPTAMLVALVVIAMYWRVATQVTLEVVTRRASFVVRGDQPQDLLNLSPQFSELRIEECATMSFSAAQFAPVPAISAMNRVPASEDSGSTRVAFTCSAGSTITLRGAAEPRGLAGVLDHVRVGPGATVVLDVYGANALVLTVDVSTSQTLHIPVHSELRIVTDLVDLSEPTVPAPVRRSLRSGLSTYRALLPESNTYIDIQTGARTVLVVTPMPESVTDFFRTDSPLPVESLQFLGEALGVDTPTPLRRGRLSYAGFPGLGTLEFTDQFLVLSRTSDMYVRSLALEPEGLKLTLDGRVVKGAIGTAGPATPKNSQWLDPRLTALQVLYYGPQWRMVLALVLWLAGTLAMWWVVSRRLHGASAGISH